jgi:hypothetical protein
MADDLSDLDILVPAASDPVSGGDDAIRDTRRQVRNWADIEHARTGEHTFVVGAPASRPAVGNAGRIWIDTTNKRLERDDGSAWNILHSVYSARAHTDAFAALTGSFSTVQTLAILDADTSVGGNILVLGRVTFLNSDADTNYTASLQLKVDGSIINPGAFFGTAFAGVLNAMTIFGLYDSELTANSHTLTLEATSSGGAVGDVTAGFRSIVALVF